MSGWFDTAFVLKYIGVTGEGTHIGLAFLLEQTAQWKVVVECDSRDTTHETFARVHGLVSANVDAFDSVELHICLVVRWERVRLGLVIVDLCEINKQWKRFVNFERV